MRIAIAGAAGQLGATLVIHFRNAGHEVVALRRSDLDLSRDDPSPLIAALAPEVVINASAYNDVDGAEDRPDAAFAVNCDGVARLADACRHSGSVFVHYSTDFVFDGLSTTPYTERDRPAPLSKYGASKLAGERAATRATRHYVLRLSSVFGGAPGQGCGGRGTIDRMADTILAGREVRAFSDRTVSPSYVIDVARATQHLISEATAPGVYHCVSSGHATWDTVALEIGDCLRMPVRLVTTRAASVTMRAPRPVFCALSNAKLASAGIVLPPWQAAVRRHLVSRLAVAPLHGPVALRADDSPRTRALQPR